MKFNKHLFHPSDLGRLMTGSRSKNDPLGETCKALLMESWIEITFGRKKDITNKYIEKGLRQEEDSITLYSLVKNKFHKKNTTTIANKFFVGTPDLYDGYSIRQSDHVIDIKTSWDIFTFFSTLSEPVNRNYYWQMQAYMDLTGAKKATLAYCLVNTPLNLILDQKRKLMWSMGVIDPDSDIEYLKKCELIDRNMIYDDIPKEKRVVTIEIERNELHINEAKEKILLCRKYLNQINKKNGNTKTIYRRLLEPGASANVNGGV
jgi:hypothetical protein